MSLTRRLAAVLPAAGVTVFASLALTGAPAAANAGEAAARAPHPAVMATPCAEGERGDDCDYGYGSTPSPGTANTAPTRGNGGYGGESPTPTPSRTTTTPPTTTPATPTASVDTVPPGGELPSSAPATPSPTTPGGVSAGGTLPLTGAPMGMTVGLGAVLVAAGAGAVFYTRRRRNA
ncbi:LPXTG cell wall anchor domain-containing protein [Actinoplanes sp. NPDC051859]|uniref:LPXTG cell wall anchor domain-containing protein n=1 Tax=Actinoplanes sp. NPDC051859 TaxID=3363909 RepID=UPI0037A046CA